MAYDHTRIAGDIPLDRLGKGPRRDPPLWARSVRLLLGHATGLMRDFYRDATPEDVWPTLLVAVCANGDVAQMECAQGYQRDAWAAQARSVFREARVVRYVQTMEAWLSTPGIRLPPGIDPRDPSLDRLLDEAPAPVSDPNRREVAFAFARERRGRSEAAVLELSRGADGRVSDLRDALAAMGGSEAIVGALGPLARLV